MKIEKRENIKGNIETIVSFKKENYIRIQKNKHDGIDMKQIVEWKKQRTNHLVNAVKHAMLEEKFKMVDPITKMAKDYSKSGLGSSNLTCHGSKEGYDAHIIKEAERKLEQDKQDLEKLRRSTGFYK